MSGAILRRRDRTARSLRVVHYSSAVNNTCDPVHGHQQLSLLHAHYDTHCFLPVHVHHVDSGK